jgi:hypothetical protein
MRAINSLISSLSGVCAKDWNWKIGFSAGGGYNVEMLVFL